MTDVARLTLADRLALGDRIPLASLAGGGLFGATLGMLVDFLRPQLATFMSARYAQPQTGGTVQLVANTIAILTPTGTLAALTLTLPSAPADGDTVRVLCKQAVTALTVTALGATVYNAPASLVAGDRPQFRYDAASTNWDRI